MRHGQANPVGTNDSQRELTEQGVNEAAIMAGWINRNRINIEQLFVSPFVRAQQTAETVTNVLEQEVASKTLNFITPSGNAKEVHDYIDGLCHSQKVDNVLIVSHMPLVSYLVAELTVNQQSPIFQTAAIAQIDYDVKTMKGTLVRVISPNEVS